MIRTGLPEKQGLYDPKFESDACGIGFVAQIDGVSTHQTIKDAITVLCRLEHRGGQGANPDTGDGAGIMLQIPDQLFRQTWKETLPAFGDYAVGMIFLPQEQAIREQVEQEIENVLREEAHDLIGWRTVPVQTDVITSDAISTMPYIKQFFIKRPEHVHSTKKFNQSLYLIRRIIEKRVMQLNGLQKGPFYIASLSPDIIVYKGMLTSYQLNQFYKDLAHPLAASSFGMVHSRYSTNTFPSWERAHPNRMLMHNGEINTITGNVNWMKARESAAKSSVYGDRHKELLPVVSEDASDSGMLDQTFEYLVRNGRTLSHSAMMMVPEAWDLNDQMTDPERACFEYLSCIMEPWDGPTALAYTDGKQIGASIDRNGLRPARYYLTEDNTIIFSSEVGVLDIEPERIVQKGRLAPGEMLLVDIENHEVLVNEEIKRTIANQHPYREWLNQSLVQLHGKSEGRPTEEGMSKEELLTFQLSHGFTNEEITKNILPMVNDKIDPIGSMGNDTPLAVLSEKPQLLFNYFKQLFAQVTNPPIDAIREKAVTSTTSYLGSKHNLLAEGPEHCHRIRLYTPILNKQEYEEIIHNGRTDFRSRKISNCFRIENGENGLESALERIFEDVEKAIAQGVSLIVLSDRDMNDKQVPVPSLLAVSGLHHYLVEKGLRTKASIIIETAEARDVHQLSMLIGYGADMVYPYLAYRTVEELIALDHITDYNYDEAIDRFRDAATSGIVKVMSKMGISTIQSYRGAQTFEAIGISNRIISKYFKGTSSKLGGIDLRTIAQESIKRHKIAYQEKNPSLESGGAMQWRHDGEHHSFNPETIHMLQHACRTNNKELYERYSKLISKENVTFLRDLLDIKTETEPISIDEVEPLESIWRRFKTGAMSYGSLSKEAHEILAVAMNRIGGKSNSGEGGEDPDRYLPDANGDSRKSAIKQVASGRFGVNSHYLTSANEIQIKMAQGAKPGEGGHLPGKKVHPWIAEVRGSTPGVGLISPPPHHDIYSIEDLSQLIYDLKHANPKARVSVKLVAKSGVGTIAAGVAKGKADLILISGYEGGTGASPKTSIRHAGLPWELGLSEAHQTLVLNNLRDRVVLETDGKLMTGKDVVKAAMLGAEEYGFSTAPLVVLGCILMRACHLDTCPVGIATQNPELRKKFLGEAEHVVNYMRFIGEEIRAIMAQLGVKTMDELVGRTDLLEVNERAAQHPKAKQLLLQPLLVQSNSEWKNQTRSYRNEYNENHIDDAQIIPKVEQTLVNKKPVALSLPIKNTDRAVGTRLGYEVTKRYGEKGLPNHTIDLTFNGSAGQSLGAFVPKGITLKVQGDANDYVGKGLSGGNIIVAPHKSSIRQMEEVTIGNVALFGATAGEVFINGAAGERFAVRNSGAHAVVEGVGDNGCEYMTGGKVVILGSIGKNFAAGMSGGTSYIWTMNPDEVANHCNREMVLIEKLEDFKEIQEVKDMLLKHVQFTGSKRAKYILNHWSEAISQFIKIIPEEFKQMQLRLEEDNNNDPQNEVEASDVVTLSK